MIHPIIFARNVLRARFHKTLIGNLIKQISRGNASSSIRLICATRSSEVNFWKSTALGISLKKWLDSPNFNAHIYYSNAVGLSTIYNTHIYSANRSDILLFIHDDVWLDDENWMLQLRKATSSYDVVGLAGNTRLSSTQPAWVFKSITNGQFVWDIGYLSGAVAHGKTSRGKIQNYGPMPMECKVIDGVFIAAKCANLRRARVSFDEQFKFHFYDLDFCRSANLAGLLIGTWPIAITHQSGGAFGSTDWHETYNRYLEKWNKT